MRTLVLNTYGGSLLLGATAVGAEIIGSYEDVAFGTPIQQANFPNLDIRGTRKEWPNQDLSETFVIAHPPCSAFSVQNTNKDSRGVDSDAFKCTHEVLSYATRNKAVGIAVESVTGALAGAWKIHQQYADEFGYNVYRILQNGSMFSAQWRDRFWVVYIKKGAGPDKMTWVLNPQWQTVGQVVEGHMDGPSPYGLDEALVKMKNKFINEAGCTQEDIDFIFNTQDPPHDTSVDGILWQRKFPTHDRWEVCKQYVTKYATSAMVFVDPKGLCPVLLGGSWWYMNGRTLPENAYKRLMGFPASYIFPEEGRHRQNFRSFLSKGVIPQVASWVLANSFNHLGVKTALEGVPSSDSPYVIEVEPNHIADFRIRKKTWGQLRPALRHDDERHAISSKVPGEPRTPRVPRAPRETVERAPRVPKSPWNSAQVEERLKETLTIRPNTADQYAFHESHGYHRMGIREGDFVLDIGAHIGCVASRAALVGARRVISIEAEQENYELLKHNVQTFPNVEPIWGAVFGGTTQSLPGVEPGAFITDEFVQLHTVERRDDGGHSTGTHSVLFKTRGKTVNVPRVDFRKLLELNPDVIKMDIEGSEFSLDFANLPTSVRAIGIELHTRRDTNRDAAKHIVKTILDQGFTTVNRLNMESNYSALVGYFVRQPVASEDSQKWLETTLQDPTK